MCMNTHIHWRTKNKTRLHFVTPFNPSMGNVTRNGNLAMPTASDGWGLSPEALAKDDLSPEALAKGETRVTSPPLSLRRSTINVGNVVVRLWQSSYNMSAGECPQCFFIYWIATVVSLPRDDKGE